MYQDSICFRLHKLFNTMTRYKWNTIADIKFDNGVYILFEDGEKYLGFDRIVRVGTHKSENRLRRRLKDHFCRENKDASIFRKNIGKAILIRENIAYLDTWGVNTGRRANIAKLGNAFNPVLQREIEDEVTKYMREHFSFICFPVTSKEERWILEEGIVASLRQATDFSSSLEWLGRFYLDDKNAEKGLWQKQGLNGNPLTESEYFNIEKYCIQC